MCENIIVHPLFTTSVGQTVNAVADPRFPSGLPVFLCLKPMILKQRIDPQGAPAGSTNAMQSRSFIYTEPKKMRSTTACQKYIDTEQWRIHDFPRVEAPTYDLPNVLKNCMKLKEFGPPGGPLPSRPSP